MAATLLGTGTGTADPASLTLGHQCPFPLIGDQPTTLKIDTDLPATMPVGAPTGERQVTTTLTIPSTGLSLVGASALTGEAHLTLHAKVTFGSTVIPIAVPVDLATEGTPSLNPSTTLVGAGRFPSLVFPESGAAAVDITETDLVMRLTPRKPDGSDTGLGTFDTVCRQNPGQPTRLATVSVVFPPIPAPATPTGLRATATTETAVSLAWDTGVEPASRYEVLVDGAHTATATSATATVTGLTAGTTYAFQVRAVDANGTASPPSEPFTVRTKLGTAVHPFHLTGTSRIAAAATTVAVAGDLRIEADRDSGEHRRTDLTLRPTKANTRLLGVLPATADVVFTVDGARSAVAEGTLTVAANVTIALPRVTVLGYVVSQSPTCRTETPAEITLRSTPDFTPTTGGSLDGAYTIPAFTGCGSATGLVNTLAAGPGNTVRLALTSP
ncbi:Fibronectin type III domain-containing protein [Actinokineospora iranica]|uniref:Fibronectin type III domain-containing protein n=2 Tax=Actinokineospora iranica TaxID=1271860 RepID=A0A1G6MBU6_9PSEU|nr:Fibronectin type III domain-containing protein [Actinokineospora iranica]